MLTKNCRCSYNLADAPIILIDATIITDRLLKDVSRDFFSLQQISKLIYFKNKQNIGSVNRMQGSSQFTILSLIPAILSLSQLYKSIYLYYEKFISQFVLIDLFKITTQINNIYILLYLLIYSTFYFYNLHIYIYITN